MDTKYKFRLEEQDDGLVYNPTPKCFSFYQICQFPIDKKYKVRKVIYNEIGDMIKYGETVLKKNILDKFLNKCPKFKYTIYPTYDLDVVGFPDPNEILTAKSQILNNDF